MRSIPNIGVDRAELRTTLAYQLFPDLSVGIEYNPKADDLGPIANWRAIDETETTPAWILGTSSDRIGTEDGRSYYATLSKSLARETGLPLSPYVGVAYGESDYEFLPVGGLVVGWNERFASYHVFDGKNLHHIFEASLPDGHALGFMIANLDGETSLGLTWSWSFAPPWK